MSKNHEFSERFRGFFRLDQMEDPPPFQDAEFDRELDELFAQLESAPEGRQ